MASMPFSMLAKPTAFSQRILPPWETATVMDGTCVLETAFSMRASALEKSYSRAAGASD